MNADAVIESVVGTAVPVLGNDLDTDRIIPARFLKEITFENMGSYLFNDERFDLEGNKTDHALNVDRYQNANIMIVQKNFGCGSSREHAPQAIKRYGIDAIIGESFAEIFAGNSKAIGMPLVRCSEQDIQLILTQIEKNPKTRFTINLVSKRVRFFEESICIDMPEPQRESFLKGTWDALSLLKQGKNDVTELSQRLPYLNEFELNL